VNEGPPNNEMQQTRHGSDGASLLISVFGGPLSGVTSLLRPLVIACLIAAPEVLAVTPAVGVCEVRQTAWPRGEGRFWVGFRNTSSEPRYLCVHSRSHSWQGADGAQLGGAIGGSSDVCSTDAEFNMILPGESLQMLWVTEVPPHVVRATVQFRAEVEVRAENGEYSQSVDLECRYAWTRLPR
jgi:hypothetical protein